MAELTDIQRDLLTLATDLKRLEAEYNMFFAGRLPRPPWETRKRVAALVTRWDRGHIPNTAERFRFQSLQARYQAFVDLWDRALRAREEGRAGPLAQPAPKEEPRKRAPGDVLQVTSFSDPAREAAKLRQLYQTVTEARRDAGEESVPFHKFAALVSSQVKKLKLAGSEEVAFRVAVKDGKVNLTVRGLKGAKS